MFVYNNQVQAYKVQPGDSFYPLSKMINPKGDILFQVHSVDRINNKMHFRLTAPKSCFLFPYIEEVGTVLRGVFAVNA